MLTEICNVLKNWFCSDRDKHIGTFTIEGGVLTPLLDLKEGQYYRVVGSVFNDGVHKYGDEQDVLSDEIFNGAVWCMSVPKAFLNLVEDIEKWQSENGNNTFQSESFGGYSYSRVAGTETWQGAFKQRLNQWRKI